MTTHERELTEPVALCTADGRLNPDAVGWSRQPIIDCSALPGSWGRRKRWDFWCVIGDGFAMNLTLADVDYLGLADVWFRDFATGEEVTATAPAPLGRGVDLAAGRGGKLLRFTDDPGGTTLAVRSTRLHADVRVDRPAHHESLTVVIPWSDTRFQCTTKDVGRPASGTITVGGRTYEPTWACLDFGRGKWPYRTTWNWGAGADPATGVALQVGGKWTDGTGMTENAVFVDGRLAVKVGDELTWAYDRTDWLQPWRVTSADGSTDLTFTPHHDKVGRLNAGVAASATDQCFGTWDGQMAATRIDHLTGWAEEATWRW